MRIIDIAEYEDIRQSFLDATKTQVEISFRVNLTHPIDFSFEGFRGREWEEGVYQGIYSPREQITTQGSFDRISGFSNSYESTYASITIPTEVYFNGIKIRNPIAPAIAIGATATINPSKISNNLGNPTITGFIVRKLYGKKLSKSLLFAIDVDTLVVGVDGTSFSAESVSYIDPVYGSTNLGQA